MKVNLIVASGVHQGKPIPVPGNQLVIGRDAGCHLRPASPAVSKKHCAIVVRDGKVWVRDFGSTNGTSVNDVPVTDQVEVGDGDRLKVGPLDFTIQVAAGKKSDSTPLPDALKAVAPKTADRSGTAETKPSASALTMTPAPMKPAGPPTQVGASASDDPDQLAAMLLSMGDEPAGTPPVVPEGSTVHEMPVMDIEKMAAAKKAENDKKKSPSAAETSNAASEILKKYMRRPK